MAKKKRQAWSAGDTFLIKASNGHWAVAQVIGREPSVLNSATVALFSYELREPTEVASCSLVPDKAFATLFVTRDTLDSGDWPIVGHGEIRIPAALFPFEGTRRNGFVGATVIGSGIVEDFVDAYFGLQPWDDWHDPQYLDKLLLDPSKKPKHVVLKGGSK